MSSLTNPFKNAVFIIGAGASEPYGFPTGYILRKNILELQHHHPETGTSKSNQTHVMFLEYLKLEGFKGNDFQKFIYDFAGTGAQSIDEFLQQYSKVNHPYHRLGQLIIYYLISIEESEWSIRREGVDWIELLIRFLMQRETQDDFLNNPPRFISFNYDNYLKYKIEFNLKTQFLKENYEFKNVINIYGKTSGLNYSKENKEVYNLVNFDEIVRESKNISIIREDDVESDLTVKEIRKNINDASKVIILGYGFNRFNNRILFKNEANLKALIQKNKIVATGLIDDKTLINKINQLGIIKNGKPLSDSKLAIRDGLNCKGLIDSMIPRHLF